MERRGFLSFLGTSALGLFASAPAGASTARALTLAELVGKSTSVLVATAVAKRSSWTTIGGAKRIVTDTRLKIEELVSGADPSATEIVVRTLGGVVGEVGQIVEGEAELTIGEQSMTFVTQIDPAFYGVTAMGQGHYPILSDARGRILRQNRQLPALVGNKTTAVATLRGRLLSDSLALVRAVRR